MTITYSYAPDVERLAEDIVVRLRMRHVRLDRFACVRSMGSRASRTVARLHSIPKIWEKALGIEPCYAIEVISERYDQLDEEEKEKTIIHELLHIPRSFRGGFRHHRNYVTGLRVRKLHDLLTERRRAAVNVKAP